MTPDLSTLEPPAHPDDSEPACRRLRVLIADGDAFARRVMRDSLQTDDEIVVIADVGHTREVLELSRYFRPDVLLIDMELPGLGGVAIARELSRDVPGSRIGIVCAEYDEEAALLALRAGVVACLSKDIDPAELRDVVRRITRGEAVIPPTLARRAIEVLREVPDSGWRPVRSRLTTREWEIVDLIASGATTQRIADTLVLSPATVYSHVKSLLRKLGVHSREDAIPVAESLRKREASPQD